MFQSKEQRTRLDEPKNGAADLPSAEDMCDRLDSELDAVIVGQGFGGVSTPPHETARLPREADRGRW